LRRYISLLLPTALFPSLEYEPKKRPQSRPTIMLAILLLLFVLGIFSLDGVPDDGSFVKRLSFSSDAADDPNSV